MDRPPNSPQRSFSRWRWMRAGAGLAALIWFLLRVLPKPSRAAYPCQRAAAPLAAGFAGQVLVMAASALAFRRGWRQRGRRMAATAFFVTASVLAGWVLFHPPSEPAWASFTPTDPPNTPVGEARGVFPGRVAWVRDPAATSWNGSANYWWDDTHTSQTVVDSMMTRSLLWLTEASTEAEAWDRIFRYFNQTHGRGNIGYHPGQGIVIKINLNNQWDYATNDNQINASPQMVLALLRQLILKAGVVQADITVYDAIRWIPDRIFDRCHAEFPNVHFMDREGQNGRDLTLWSDPVIHYAGGSMTPEARQIPVRVRDASYLISLALLKAHKWCAPVTLSGKNHFGSIADPGTLHGYVSPEGQTGYDPEVDLLGHAQLGGKTILFLLDGLFGGRDVVSIGQPWQSTPFNNDWPSSLFASLDGIALDSVGVDFLRTEMFYELPPHTDNYLHEAAQANAPPSGVFYDPEGDGTGLASLGVHEHWDAATTKHYSRNLGGGTGIELVSADPGSDQMPSVSITYPFDGAIFAPGTDVVLRANASDPDGTITRVVFVNEEGNILGEDFSSPFEFRWNAPPTGNHAVKAWVSDDRGAISWSDSVPFTVTDAAGSVSGLSVSRSSGSDLTLSWNPSCLVSDDDYLIYEGSLAIFFSHQPRTCSTSGFTTWTFQPDPGNRYFLVVPRTDFHEGSPGSDSNGQVRPSGTLSCLERILGECPAPAP